jgi:hypothetical protein
MASFVKGRSSAQTSQGNMVDEGYLWAVIGRCLTFRGGRTGRTGRAGLVSGAGLCGLKELILGESSSKLGKAEKGKAMRSMGADSLMSEESDKLLGIGRGLLGF